MMKIGDHVIQIPLDWPAREGTVTIAEERCIYVAWDDGRKSWHHEADFVRDGIWLVEPPKLQFPKPGELESLGLCRECLESSVKS